MTPHALGLDIAGYTEALRFILGIILMYSGAEKLRDISAFVSGVQQYQILHPSLGRWYGRILPFVELGTGLLIFLGIEINLISLISSFIFISFFIAVSINLSRKRNIPCHCFGTDSSMIGWHTLMRICLLFLISVYLTASRISNDIFQEIILINQGLNWVEIIPMVLLVVFGLLILAIIDVLPQVVSSWTARPVKPRPKKRIIVWTKVNEEKTGESE
jgi:uncharacterized membrane protein YphA (DoxX/SURF4 family)